MSRFESPRCYDCVMHCKHVISCHIHNHVVSIFATSITTDWSYWCLPYGTRTNQCPAWHERRHAETHGPVQSRWASRVALELLVGTAHGAIVMRSQDLVETPSPFLFCKSRGLNFRSSQSHFSCSLWLLVDPCRHNLLLSSLRRVTRPGHQSTAKKRRFLDLS